MEAETHFVKCFFPNKIVNLFLTYFKSLLMQAYVTLLSLHWLDIIW